MKASYPGELHKSVGTPVNVGGTTAYVAGNLPLSLVSHLVNQDCSVLLSGNRKKVYLLTKYADYVRE